jgi:hypothetical protein
VRKPLNWTPSRVTSESALSKSGNPMRHLHDVSRRWSF